MACPSDQHKFVIMRYILWWNICTTDKKCLIICDAFILVRVTGVPRGAEMHFFTREPTEKKNYVFVVILASVVTGDPDDIQHVKDEGFWYSATFLTISTEQPQ